MSDEAVSDYEKGYADAMLDVARHLRERRDEARTRSRNVEHTGEIPVSHGLRSAWELTAALLGSYANYLDSYAGRRLLERG